MKRFLLYLFKKEKAGEFVEYRCDLCNKNIPKSNPELCKECEKKIMKVYTYEINLSTFKIKESSFNLQVETIEDEYNISYNEDGWGNIYSEARSPEEAKRNAFEYCLKMNNAFRLAAREIYREDN